MQHFALESLLNTTLAVESIQDFCPNGLQVEGRKDVNFIITGVTASLALIEYAIERNADAILVHHGYFWKNESPCIKGMKGQRIKKLLLHGINLYAYHLPLDIHPVLGNNAQLAKRLGIEALQGLESSSTSIPVFGTLSTPLSAQQLQQRLSENLQRPIIYCGKYPHEIIHTVGLCTGGGQGYIDLAAQQGIDAFISGEISEQTMHSAHEQNIHFFAAGHHATERYGVKALGEWLAKEHHLHVEFKDIDNPA